MEVGMSRYFCYWDKDKYDHLIFMQQGPFFNSALNHFCQTSKFCENGWIYFRRKNKSTVKIGRTEQEMPWNRWGSKTFLAIATTLPIAEERRWQGMFWHRWVTGELYDLTESDLLQTIKILKEEQRTFIAIASLL